MKCPLCNVELRITERQGIEIDYCPQCRGVWLDRGELDKLIERSYSTSPPPSPGYQEPRGYQHHHGERQPQYQQHYQQQPQYQQQQYQQPDQPHGHQKSRKKRGFLEDLFDFD
ncbi:TFIIB-type zinc ribbon-containing protein [Desulfobacca acetoxidans]|jgi:Zn-finger nucleic acid-binding protein|uniref:Transcription factor zinc-finger domain-containing protein n=1 Tax=Desulfobacca acetoxidans (strain ATCC 700848 / DSM 11109 / ASRB2) TaxID=880072 RepID=F2NDN7_DESAR|nr:zf-TFIIB domain-containing protein [Desulfobacca acetoxidans]AEB10313.1 hypothetical protein Desac_2492 [Desulfobacca acetoxidans DSM 11109]